MNKKEEKQKEQVQQYGFPGANDLYSSKTPRSLRFRFGEDKPASSVTRVWMLNNLFADVARATSPQTRFPAPFPV